MVFFLFRLSFVPIWALIFTVDVNARDWVFQPQVQSGFTFGTVSVPTGTGSFDDEALGGVLVGGGVSTELGRTLGAGVQYVMMVDLVNEQISRRALGTRFTMNLLGGAPTILQSSKFGKVYSGYLYQLAAITEVSMSDYDAATGDLSNQLSGSVFEINLGFLFRRSGYGMELLTTIFSVPASNERLSTRMTSLNLFYHI